MAKNPLVDQDVYPPFDGFPREGLNFLSKLKKNNNRPWFQKHKTEYEELVRFPMQCLVVSLGRELAEVAPEFIFDPKRSIFRIYRDVRFSKNKAPYKTNIAASFELRGSKSPIELPGLYVGIEPGEIFIGGGVYMPSGEQLKAIRQAIVTRPADLESILRNAKFKKRFSGILGDRLQKAPLGYPKDHPQIEHLRLKQFYVGIETKHTSCYTATFLDIVSGTFRDALPFIRWLVKATT